MQYQIWSLLITRSIVCLKWVLQKKNVNWRILSSNLNDRQIFILICRQKMSIDRWKDVRDCIMSLGTKESIKFDISQCLSLVKPGQPTFGTNYFENSNTTGVKIQFYRASPPYRIWDTIQFRAKTYSRWFSHYWIKNLIKSLLFHRQS